jgi:hypothetical protein
MVKPRTSMSFRPAPLGEGSDNVVDYKQEVQRAFGKLGIGAIQIGSTVLEAEMPEGQVDVLEGFGDTIHVGDVIWTKNSKFRGIPERVHAILRNDEDQNFILWTRRVFEGPLEAWTCGVTSFCTNGPPWVTPPWREEFTKLTQHDLDDWFKSRPVPPDGWQPVGDVWCQYGECLVKDGKPIQVRRKSKDRMSNYADIKLIAELAGKLTGWVPVISPKYSDPEKLTRDVLSVTPIQPPRI